MARHRGIKRLRDTATLASRARSRSRWLPVCLVAAGFAVFAAPVNASSGHDFDGFGFGIAMTQGGRILVETPTADYGVRLLQLSPDGAQLRDAGGAPAPGFTSRLDWLDVAGDDAFITQQTEGPDTSVTAVSPSGESTSVEHCVGGDCTQPGRGCRIVASDGDHYARSCWPYTSVDIIDPATSDVVSRPLQADRMTGNWSWTFRAVWLAGDLIAGYPPGGGPVTVSNWRTGEELFELKGDQDPQLGVLAPDGRFFFSVFNFKALASAIRVQGPGDSYPRETSWYGEPVAFRDGRLVVSIFSYNAGPETLLVIDHDRVIDKMPWSGGIAAFNGTRLTYFRGTCLASRLMVWDIGQDRPTDAPPCARPKLRHLIVFRKPGKATHIDLDIVCPASATQGCGVDRVKIPPLKDPYPEWLPSARARPGQTLRWHLQSRWGPACNKFRRVRRTRVGLLTGGRGWSYATVPVSADCR